jgi:DNA-binding MarR family transcriptional regulator
MLQQLYFWLHLNLWGGSQQETSDPSSFVSAGVRDECEMVMANLKAEIEQIAPFSSIEEEAILNLLRTSDCMSRAFHQKTRAWGLTSTQYNVLRILRGAQPEGLTCAAIGARMITAEPDITRLLARLKTLKLIRQHRDSHDRRVLWTQITDAGLNVLHKMDPVIESLPKELLGHMSREDLGGIIRLLELARQPFCNAKARE